MELIGGSGGSGAGDCCWGALRAGRHVVTANKALVAHAMGRSWRRRSESKRRGAGVRGGGGWRDTGHKGECAKGWRATGSRRMSRAYLNGTCNYILTTMRERGREFAEVLADAQRLGLCGGRSRPSMWTGSMRRISWRFWRRWRLGGRCGLAAMCMWRGSAGFRRWTMLLRGSLVFASSCWGWRGGPRRDRDAGTSLHGAGERAAGPSGRGLQCGRG